MDGVYERTAWLIGEAAVRRLAESRVAVFGAGGVGGYVIEALARAGVGSSEPGCLTIVDFDSIDITNINRQIIALHSTIGRPKVAVMAERISDINPEIKLIPRCQLIDAETIKDYDFAAYDYVVDAVDDVAAKLLIIEGAKAAGTPVISSMGTGNKLDPSKFQITDISKTHTCPLARKVRKELARRDIKDVKILFSDENPQRAYTPELQKGERLSPASISFVPSAAGLLIASEVVRDLAAMPAKADHAGSSGHS